MDTTLPPLPGHVKRAEQRTNTKSVCELRGLKIICAKNRSESPAPTSMGGYQLGKDIYGVASFLFNPPHIYDDATARGKDRANVFIFPINGITYRSSDTS